MVREGFRTEGRDSFKGSASTYNAPGATGKALRSLPGGTLVYIYVAGPYSKGQTAAHVRRACDLPIFYDLSEVPDLMEVA